MRTVFSVAAVVVLMVGVAACSKTAVPLQGAAMKTGWTQANVDSTRSACTDQLVRSGDTQDVAQKYCSCLLSKAPYQISFTDYTTPTPATQDILNKINDECEASLN